MKIDTPRIVFRFRTPYGTPRKPVSEVMVDALIRLGEAHELAPLVEAAEARGHNVTIELFRARNGRPLLINFSTEEAA